MREIRYDRQLRLWGDEGQSSIEAAAICILGANALATEIAKSLVLAGVGSIVIIDGEIVSDDDLGDNFFFDDQCLGKPRAEAAARLLQELNSATKARGLEADVARLQGKDILNLGRFSLVVATNLLETVAVNINDDLFLAGIPFINCRAYGLIGYIRVSVMEHYILNTRTENPRPDFRLDSPFPGLSQLYEELDFDAMGHDQFKHTPYIYLLMKALEMFQERKGDSSAFPKSYAERKQVLELLSHLTQSSGIDEANVEEAAAAVNRCLYPTMVPAKVQEIFDSPKCNKSIEPFWMVSYALKKFVKLHGCLPLSDSLPDMASDSKSYARLVDAFRTKAEADAEEVLELAREVEQTRGTEALLQPERCRRFCKNSRFIAIQRGSSIRNDTDAGWDKVIDELALTHPEPNEVAPLVWLILLRAADKFMELKKRHPGTNGVPMSIDVAILGDCISQLIDGSKSNSKSIALSKIPKKAIEEFCRFGSSSPHVTSALIGGIAAQEVIKLSTNQYTPLNDTFIVDLHTQKSWTSRF